MSIEVYNAGRSMSSLKAQGSGGAIIKLNSNELPYQLAPAVEAVIKQDAKLISHYPEFNCLKLRNLLAEVIGGLNFDNILLTAGSSEAIFLAINVLTEIGSEIIISTHAFQLYQICAKRQDRVVVLVDETVEWQQNLHNILGSITPKTQMIFLTNPSNPLGTWFTRVELESFLNAVPLHITVVVDEAYYEFMFQECEYISAVHFLDKHPNIVITRTFSKLYGLAGVRIGYAIAAKTKIDLLKKNQLPFSVNSIALSLAISSIEELKFYKGLADRIITTRNYLYHALLQRGLVVLANSANFITIQCSQASLVIALLEGESIYVRGLANYGLREYIRVTVGSEMQMQYFLERFSNIIAKLEQ